MTCYNFLDARWKWQLWKVCFAVEDADSTAFTWHHRLRYFSYMLFGVKNIRESIQFAIMHVILSNFNWQFALTFSFTQFCSHIHQTTELSSSKSTRFIKWCRSDTQTVHDWDFTHRSNYLWHVKPPERPDVSSHTTDAAHDMHPLTRIMEVRSLLVLCNVIQTFGLNFKEIAEPMATKLQKFRTNASWESFRRWVTHHNFTARGTRVSTCLRSRAQRLKIHVWYRPCNQQFVCSLLRKIPERYNTPTWYWSHTLTRPKTPMILHISNSWLSYAPLLL